jgi:pilus assembly protein Flp/PilA
MFENVQPEHEHPARHEHSRKTHEMARLHAETVRLCACYITGSRSVTHVARFARRRLLRESAAVTALEYAIMASLVAIVIVASLRVLGSSTSSTFQKIATTL